jgi:hypothetical protein
MGISAKSSCVFFILFLAKQFTHSWGRRSHSSDFEAKGVNWVQARGFSGRVKSEEHSDGRRSPPPRAEQKEPFFSRQGDLDVVLVGFQALLKSQGDFLSVFDDKDFQKDDLTLARMLPLA